MLKTKEIENLNEIANIIVNEEGCCKIPLLHGTRRYAIQVSDYDRQRFYNACKEVILFAKTLMIGIIRIIHTPFSVAELIIL